MTAPSDKAARVGAATDAEYAVARWLYEFIEKGTCNSVRTTVYFAQAFYDRLREYARASQPATSEGESVVLHRVKYGDNVGAWFICRGFHVEAEHEHATFRRQGEKP